VVKYSYHCFFKKFIQSEFKVNIEVIIASVKTGISLMKFFTRGKAIFYEMILHNNKAARRKMA